MKPRAVALGSYVFPFLYNPSKSVNNYCFIAILLMIIDILFDCNHHCFSKGYRESSFYVSFM